MCGLLPECVYLPVCGQLLKRVCQLCLCWKVDRCNAGLVKDVAESLLCNAYTSLLRLHGAYVFVLHIVAPLVCGL